MTMIQPTPVRPDERQADETRELFVDRQEGKGTWRKELVPAAVTGLPRDSYVYRAPRKTDPMTYSWHGDRQTFCPPVWWDLAIGSGPCGFGCRACFLMLTFRAMRDPMRPVIYDNLDYLWKCVGKWLASPARKKTHTLGLGIDRSDSLLYEGLTGHARTLVPWFADPARNPAGCKLILLTKSANVHFLEGLPTANVAVTFSLNPEPIADLWEGKYPDTLERISPPIYARLAACRRAQDMGFETRLRLDPILTPDGWQDMYASFFSSIARLGLRPSRITLGTYREKNAQLDSWRAKWGLPAMEWQPPEMTQEGTHRHLASDHRAAAYVTVRDLLAKYLPGTPVGLCKETGDVRQRAGGANSVCNCMV